MSSKTQSERSSTSSISSSPLSKTSPKSLIVSKVSLIKSEEWLFDDLSCNYPDVKKVSRNHDQDGRELGSIRVDFQSEDIVSDILDEGVIYIENRSYYIRPYWPLVCYRCQNEGHVSAQCPQQPIPEWRLKELLQEQKTNFESLINAFENRWNARLATVKPPSNSTDIDQLLPIVNGLGTVCQQLSQHNIQIQKQLSTIANHVQNMQTKVNK